MAGRMSRGCSADTPDLVQGREGAGSLGARAAAWLWGALLHPGFAPRDAGLKWHSPLSHHRGFPPHFLRDFTPSNHPGHSLCKVTAVSKVDHLRSTRLDFP